MRPCSDHGQRKAEVLVWLEAGQQLAGQEDREVEEGTKTLKLGNKLDRVLGIVDIVLGECARGYHHTIHRADTAILEQQRTKKEM